MGFLSVSGYEGTEKVDLGNGYWCEVKRCLTSAEKARVDDLLGAKQRVDVAGKTQFAELDYSAMRTEMLVQSLVAWNLDDDNGDEWPLDAGGKFAGRGSENPWPPGCPRRQSVARLPSPVFDVIYEKCDELNSPRRGADAVSFPDPAVGGGPDGDGGPAGPAADAVGAGDVAEARPDQGGGGAAAAP